MSSDKLFLSPLLQLQLDLVRSIMTVSVPPKQPDPNTENMRKSTKLNKLLKHLKQLIKQLLNQLKQLT